MCAVSLSVDVINVVSNNIIEENFIDDDEIIDHKQAVLGRFGGSKKGSKKGDFPKMAI